MSIGFTLLPFVAVLNSVSLCNVEKNANRHADCVPDRVKPLGGTMAAQARMTSVAFALAAAITALPSTASVLYAEGTDLSNVAASPTSLSPLVAGVNTISGSLCILFTINDAVSPAVDNCFPTTDIRDAFQTSLPSGYKITEISATISGYFSSSSLISGAVEFDFTGTGGSGSIGNTFLADGLVIDNTNTILGPGDVTGILEFGANNTPTNVLGLSGGDSAEYSYTVSITTERTSVPEPATLTLLGLGLAGLGFSRRKH